MLAMRQAGICAHISSLPGPWGIGDLGACARELVDWMASAGVSVWQVLPTGPTGFGNSPYQLLSAFAGNPLFIDLADLAELGLLEPFEVGRARAGHGGRIDYGSVIADREYLLGVAAGRMDRVSQPGLLDEYAQFVAAEEDIWLRDYALYSTLKRWHGLRPWLQWEARFRDRDKAALETWQRDQAPEIERVRRIQFLLCRQWRSLRDYARSHGISLFGDVPIYLAHDCADAWAGREMLALEADGSPLEVAGVPPDYFSADGQRWGNPLYRWDWHAEHGFDWWIRRLGHAFRQLDMVRLDHFRGFEAFWAIPADRPASDGQWRPGPGAALFDAIRTALGPCELVAEDLGVITDDVTALRRKFDMPGMQVLQFLVGADEFHEQRIGEDCVCYTGTHDNDTTVGWFSGSGRLHGEALASWQRLICERLQCGADDVHRAMISLALDCGARLAVVPVQDVLGLGSDARMNHPGTDAGNWEWRLEPGQLDADAAESLRAMIEASGRLG